MTRSRFATKEERRQLEQSRQRQQAIHWQRELIRLKKRAGKAATARGYDQVNEELGEAMDQFGAGNYGDWSLDEIAKKAGRIQRLARMLQAARQVPHTLSRYEGAKKEAGL